MSCSRARNRSSSGRSVIPTPKKGGSIIDFTELKKKQRATWALGEYDRIADGLTISTDQTLRVAKIRPGERVLDLATGTGITAIAARERGAHVTGVDLTPELLAVAKKKAEDEGFIDIEFREGDAEALPFGDASFDVVLSTRGHMFAPDQSKVAAELARVTRLRGRAATDRPSAQPQACRGVRWKRFAANCLRSLAATAPPTERCVGAANTSSRALFDRE